MDTQLLNRWFKKGYTSREMAWFLLLSEIGSADYPPTGAEEISDRWETLHEEVVKYVYQK